MSKKNGETSNEAMMERCEAGIGYHFRQHSLLQQSLTHSSLREKSGGVCNERLEFLGDAVLGLVISEFLYLTFRDFDEGDLSLIKSEVVSRTTLARIARKLKLHLCFVCGKGVQKDLSGIPPSMLANVMEAILGAMFLDSNIDVVRSFILEHFRQEIEKVIKNPYQKNYKSLLQCVAQKYLGNTPSYQMLRLEGPNHTRTFTCCAVIGKRNFLSGQGMNKKEAEQAAAYAALQILALENNSIGEHLQTLLPAEKKTGENELITRIPTLFHNSKSLLQNIVQKFGLPMPVYQKPVLVEEKAKKIWFVGITLGGRSFPEGKGMIKKDAERLAARQVLEVLAEEHSPKSHFLYVPHHHLVPETAPAMPPLFYRLALLG
jgi:ribonuclease-3